MKRVEFSIANFNLLNLNEPGEPIYDNKKGWDQEQYDKKIEWTARQIDLLNADIVTFEELWNQKSLENILNRITKKTYTSLVPKWADGKKIFCAAIVRSDLVVGQGEWIERFPEKYILKCKNNDSQTPEIGIEIKGFSRPLLHFVIRPCSEQRDISIFVCHLKSKAPTDVRSEDWYLQNEAYYKKHFNCIGSVLSTIRRTVEAGGLRFILNDLMKNNDSPIILIGDMNDGTYSNTSNILTEQPNYLVGDSFGGGDLSLYSTQTMQEYRDTRDVIYTYVHKGMRESLDQIFVSQELYDHSKKRIWLFKELLVNNDHLNNDNHKEDGTNDHGLIKAVFYLSPKK